MKLVGVAMAKNEGDVIEAFVRRNLRFLDHLVVIDHDSVDATSAILFKLRDEGLPVSVGLDRSLAFDQGARMTPAIAQAFALFEADYVFALDADEFILAPSRAALEAKLADLPDDRVGQLGWALYLDDARRVVDTRMVQSKAVVGRAFAERGWSISAGNHWVIDETGAAMVSNVALEGVALAHRPFRSVAQVTQKIVLGHFAHRLAVGSSEATAHINWHWRHVYGRIVADGLTEADLETLALQSYLGATPFEHAAETKPPATVDDPLPAVESRYADLARVDPMKALIAFTDRLLASAGR